MPGIGREENMENTNIVLRDIKNLRSNAKNMLETAEKLANSVFEIKQASKKESDTNKRIEYQEAMEEINLHIRGLKKVLGEVEESNLFRNKIDIPKHKR